jgi:thiol-disulfide isomerase/thioredoxin
MRSRRFFFAVFCLAAGLCLAGPEAWPDLAFTDLDGTSRRPLEPGEKAGVVLIFYWQDCPISNSYAPELNRLAASHTNFAFYVVQVDPDLSPVAAKEHARQFALHLPVLLDPQHRLVQLTKATVTPEAVVVGKNGEVLYRGRIDDHYAAFGKQRAAAQHHDLLEALEAITVGQPVKHKETQAVGCLIQ